MIIIFSDYTLNDYITNLLAVDSMASVIEYKMHLYKLLSKLLNIYLMNVELYAFHYYYTKHFLDNFVFIYKL